MIEQNSDLVEPPPACSTDHANGPSAINPSENTARPNLWDQAFERLRHDNHELIEAYERILRDGINAREGASRNEEIQAVIDQRLEEIKSRQWNFQLKGTNIRIREQIDRIVNVVTTIRDLGNVLTAFDPVHAGPAWAGVCVLLSVSPSKRKQVKPA